MKAAAVVLAVILLATMRLHVGFPLVASYSLAVPVPVLVLAAELGTCAALAWLIAHATGWRAWPYSGRLA